MTASCDFDPTYRGSLVGLGSAPDFGRAYRGWLGSAPASVLAGATIDPPDPTPATPDPDPDPDDPRPAYPRRLQPARRT
jgi:hypothetical protein